MEEGAKASTILLFVNRVTNQITQRQRILQPNESVRLRTATEDVWLSDRLEHQTVIYPPNLLDDSNHMISEPVLGNYGRDQDSREIFVTYTSHIHTYTIHNIKP